MTHSYLIQEPRLRVDSTVLEGGVIVVDVAAGTDKLWFRPAGHPTIVVSVVGGRAEFRLPPQVRGGTSVLISDLKFPNPSSTEVLVVGGQE